MANPLHNHKEEDDDDDDDDDDEEEEEEEEEDHDEDDGDADGEEDENLLVANHKENSNSAMAAESRLLDEKNEPAAIHGEDARHAPLDLSFQAIHEELVKQWRLGLPVAVVNLLWFLKFLATALLLGRLGSTVESAGGTLALTIANLSGYSILLGLATGMEPICSQAFGAGRIDLMSSTLSASIMMLLVAALPISIAWLQIEKILLFLGQDPSLAIEISRFLRFLLPDLLLQAAICPIRIFLRCRGETKPMAIASAAGVLFQIALGLMLHRRLRGAGIALAMGIGDLFTLALVVAFVLHDSKSLRKKKRKKKKKKKRWKWKPLLGLALPSCATICLEWWCYEIIFLFSGLLKDPKTAIPAVAIILNCDALLYSIQITLASCAATRVGHELGANSPAAAGTAAIASLAVAAAVGSATLIAMLTLRSSWIRLFTDDAAVASEIWRSVPVVAVIELGNFVLAVLCGILRGSARPAAGAVAAFGSFYALGLPCGVAMGFVAGLGIMGLWIGLLVAVVATVGLTAMVVLETNWGELARTSQIQLRSWECQVELDRGIDDWYQLGDEEMEEI